MASTTLKRAADLGLTPRKMAEVTFPNGRKATKTEIKVVPEFAVFIDTHRDQPHVPTFEDDIHRGWCRPTIVHYIPPTSATGPMGWMMRDDGRIIEVDPKHRFVEVDWWRGWLVTHVLEHGSSPLEPDGVEYAGQMRTTLLRDARNKVYQLKSLRQLVRSRETATVTATGAAFAPRRRKAKPAA
jgi:hypothetical protein